MIQDRIKAKQNLDKILAENEKRIKEQQQTIEMQQQKISEERKKEQQRAELERVHFLLHFPLLHPNNDTATSPLSVPFFFFCPPKSFSSLATRRQSVFHALCSSTCTDEWSSHSTANSQRPTVSP